jgi:hypothetical protein
VCTIIRQQKSASHAVLFANDRTRYASMSGQLSPHQRELIRVAAAGMPMDAKITAATDSDTPGGKSAEDIRKAVGLTGRDDLIFVLHQPDGFKDWSDHLQNRPNWSLARQLLEPSVT